MQRSVTVAIFAISCFVVIFLIAILWATRPVDKKEPGSHGTEQQWESFTEPGQQ